MQNVTLSMYTQKRVRTKKKTNTKEFPSFEAHVTYKFREFMTVETWNNLTQYLAFVILFRCYYIIAGILLR